MEAKICAWFNQVFPQFRAAAEAFRNADFIRGYYAAILTVLAVLVFLLILFLILKIAFRCRRASEVTVPHPDGDVVLAAGAVESVVRSCAGAFGGLSLERIRICRQGRKYFLMAQCAFDGGRGSFPAVASEFKKSAFDALESTFGIRSIRRITLKLGVFHMPPPAPAVAAAEAASPEFAPEDK